LKYFEKNKSMTREVRNCIITFLINDADGDLGCIGNFSRKNPFIELARYSNYIQQLKVLQKLYLKIHIKTKLKVWKYPFLVINDLHSILKLLSIWYL
jgi:hypothetical protein